MWCWTTVIPVPRTQGRKTAGSSRLAQNTVRSCLNNDNKNSVVKKMNKLCIQCFEKVSLHVSLFFMVTKPIHEFAQPCTHTHHIFIMYLGSTLSKSCQHCREDVSGRWPLAWLSICWGSSQAQSLQVWQWASTCVPARMAVHSSSASTFSSVKWKTLGDCPPSKGCCAD